MKNERASIRGGTLSGGGPLSGDRTTRVTVELDWDAPEPGVLVHAVRTTERCEDVGSHLEAWQRAAQYGAGFALQAVNTLPCVVHVLEVAAAPNSSSATIVAAATARAVWSALRHVPSPEVQAHMESVIVESRSCPPDQLCLFRTH